MKNTRNVKKLIYSLLLILFAGTGAVAPMLPESPRENPSGLCKLSFSSDETEPDDRIEIAGKTDLDKRATLIARNANDLGYFVQFFNTHGANITNWDEVAREAALNTNHRCLEWFFNRDRNFYAAIPDWDGESIKGLDSLDDLLGLDRRLDKRAAFIARNDSDLGYFMEFFKTYSAKITDWDEVACHAVMNTNFDCMRWFFDCYQANITDWNLVAKLGAARNPNPTCLKWFFSQDRNFYTHITYRGDLVAESVAHNSDHRCLEWFFNPDRNFYTNIADWNWVACCVAQNPNPTCLKWFFNRERHFNADITNWDWVASFAAHNSNPTCCEWFRTFIQNRTNQ